MDIKVIELVRAVNGTPVGAYDDKAPVARISTDTRLLGKDDVFFAFSGENFNGHDFIATAIEKGARHIVFSESGRIPPSWDGMANFIQVRDTVKAYGDLAAWWRRRFRVPVVAVTGSSGKTTVKELLAHLLSAKFKVLKNRGTENNLIGVPKTLLQLNASHEAAVIEMGTNQPGEIERLSTLTGAQIGILTMIGASHLEGLKDLEGVRREKMSLLKGIERGGWFLINGEDGMLRDAQTGMHKLVVCGLSKLGNAAWAEDIRFSAEGSAFTLNGQHHFETRLLGRHNVLNCVLALQCAIILGVDIAVLQRALKDFKPVPGRLCLKDLDGVHFLDDTYNSNPGSFRAAVKTLEESASRGKKGIVCGDMLELGAHSERLHRELGGFIAAMSPDFVVAAGERSKFLVEEARKRGYDGQRLFHAADALEAGSIARKLASPGDLVLVKGSRGMQMEKVFDCFISSYTR